MITNAPSQAELEARAVLLDLLGDTITAARQAQDLGKMLTPEQRALISALITVSVKLREGLR